jgi:hypothetical protein
LSTAIHEIQRAFVLWVSGVSLADINTLSEVEMLRECGALVELDPSPITGPQAQHYQFFSGLLPGHFGFFDTLMPLCHLPQWKQGTSSYTVVESHDGWDATPKMLPDLLRAARWRVQYEQTTPDELVARVHSLAQAEPVLGTCHIVKCTADAADQFTLSSPTCREAIVQALRVAHSWTGEAGLLALLSDIQPASVKRFVNINNFLAEMGIIERDVQRGLIDWPNSLAYYAGHGQLWVNLLWREPQGSVHPQRDYEEVRNTLIRGLPAKLRDDETGEPVIEAVYRKEELYSDEYLFCAPDLVVIFKPGYVPSQASAHLDFDETTFTMPAAGTVAMAGAHPKTLKGFLLASAPSIIPGIALPEPAPLTSVVPSLLHALDVEYSGMDSQALSGLFSLSYLAMHPIRAGLHSQELSEEDEELVINRLRDLGYV